jgi:hypothetical protein
MDKDQGQRSAIGGGQPKSHYNEPKGRIFDRAANDLRDVLIVGKDADGKLQLWSSTDQRSTVELFDQAREFVTEPTT